MKKHFPIRYYILLAILLSIGMSTYWFLAGELLPVAAEAAVAILIAALPLPLWLGQHLPLARGMRKTNEADIGLQSPSILMAASQIDTLVVSKNGIITEGRPYVAGLIPEGSVKVPCLRWPLLPSAKRFTLSGRPSIRQQ